MPPRRHDTVQVFRTGRFRCELEGRTCTVIDGAAGDPAPQLRAKLTEWIELLDAISAAASARELRHRQQGRDE